jgi:hypothetical protein
MNANDRIERVERLCLICWDAYLDEVTTEHRALVELIELWADGRLQPGGMTASELHKWLDHRVVELRHDALIEVEKEDKGLAAHLSERAEARRLRERTKENET